MPPRLAANLPEQPGGQLVVADVRERVDVERRQRHWPGRPDQPDDELVAAGAVVQLDDRLAAAGRARRSRAATIFSPRCSSSRTTGRPRARPEQPRPRARRRAVEADRSPASSRHGRSAGSAPAARSASADHDRRPRAVPADVRRVAGERRDARQPDADRARLEVEHHPRQRGALPAARRVRVAQQRVVGDRVRGRERERRRRVDSSRRASSLPARTRSRSQPG